MVGAWKTILVWENFKGGAAQAVKAWGRSRDNEPEMSLQSLLEITALCLQLA